MASACFMSKIGFSAGCMELPTTRGRINLNHLIALSRQTLSTDSIGVFALTLLNVVVGSSIQVEDQAGTTTLYNGVAATSSPLINLSAYAGGSGLNNIRIKVRKGSAAPYYIPWETVANAVVGSASIYVAQVSDE